MYGISPDTVGGDVYEQYRRALRAIPLGNAVTHNNAYIKSVREAVRLFASVRGLERLAQELENATYALENAAHNVESLISQIENLDEG
jgi:hypothetical protein